MDLEAMCAAVAGDLDDAGNAIWTTEELERAVRRALRDYSTASPRRAEAILTLTGAGRELDIAGLDGLIGVERIWFPYDAAAPDWPPHWRAFEAWPEGFLFLDVAEEPAAGEKARLFYWALHTLAGLDGATETTVPAEDEDLVALGAAGYAALEQARAAIGTINVSGYTPLHWRAWAEARLAEFGRRLGDLARRRGVGVAGPAVMG